MSDERSERVSESLSVLVATKNRPDQLITCVASVLRQEPAPLEVVVVDQSREPGDAAVRELFACSAIRLVYEYAPDVPGLTHARNRAVARASGAVLLFLDDDVVLEPGYVREILKVLAADRDGRVGGVGGYITNLVEKLSTAQRIRSLLFYRGPFSVDRDTLLFHLHPGDRPRRALRLHGGDMAIRRQVFEHLRFDEGYTGYSFGEDRDFTVELSRRYELWWVPQARVAHHEAPQNRLTREHFCELRILSWRRFYERCVPKTVYTALCYLWLNIGFVTLLCKVWDWATVRGTYRGLRRLVRILLGRELLSSALGQGWQARSSDLPSTDLPA